MEETASPRAPERVSPTPVAPQELRVGRAPLRRFRVPWGLVLRLAILAMAGAIVVLFTTQWTRWIGDSVRQQTDDAYIRGDLTPLSAQVDGDVQRVAVNDFQWAKPALAASVSTNGSVVHGQKPDPASPNQRKGAP